METIRKCEYKTWIFVWAINSNFVYVMSIDIIFKIAAVGLLTAIINQILKKSDEDEIATLVTLTGLIIVLLMVIDLISQLFTSLDSIFGLY